MKLETLKDLERELNDRAAHLHIKWKRRFSVAVRSSCKKGESANASLSVALEGAFADFDLFG